MAQDENLTALGKLAEAPLQTETDIAIAYSIHGTHREGIAPSPTKEPGCTCRSTSLNSPSSKPIWGRATEPDRRRADDDQHAKGCPVMETLHPDVITPLAACRT